MAFEIVWLTGAIDDLQRLREFVQRDNPVVAQRVAERILEATTFLSNNSEIGRSVDGLLDFRDLVIPFGASSYVLRYRQLNQTIIIVRLKHNRENLF